MRHDKLGLQLELLLMLTENRQWTIDMMCERLGLQRRNVYYYLQFFRQADFGLEKRGGYYCISRESPFISKLCDVVKFTDSEAITIKNLLQAADSRNPIISSALKKMERFYDFHVMERDKLNSEQQVMADQLYNAIMEEKIVIIRDYSSPHSGSVSDRKVEPFLLINGNRDVRAYEISSKTNKTFRISRMGAVLPTSKQWIHRNMHKTMFTDHFNFSSEHPVDVCLRLDQLSHNVLLEEYPRAEHDIEQQEDGTWLFKPSVCSMIGIGRFVIGMFDHIEIIDSPELQAYVTEKLNAFHQKANQ